jgi:hypothetical protein
LKSTSPVISRGNTSSIWENEKGCVETYHRIWLHSLNDFEHHDQLYELVRNQDKKYLLEDNQSLRARARIKIHQRINTSIQDFTAKRVTIRQLNGARANSRGFSIFVNCLGTWEQWWNRYKFA